MKKEQKTATPTVRRRVQTVVRNCRELGQMAAKAEDKFLEFVDRIADKVCIFEISPFYWIAHLILWASWYIDESEQGAFDFASRFTGALQSKVAWWHMITFVALFPLSVGFSLVSLEIWGAAFAALMLPQMVIGFGLYEKAARRERLERAEKK